MKQYILNSTSEQSSIGAIEVSDDFTVIEIKIKPEQTEKYRGAIRRVISSVIKQGSFEVVFENETMKISNANKLLLQAITQSLISSMTIVPEEIQEVQQILTSD